MTVVFKRERDKGFTAHRKREKERGKREKERERENGLTRITQIIGIERKHGTGGKGDTGLPQRAKQPVTSEMPNPVTHHRSKREKERQGEREKERKRERGNEKTKRKRERGKERKRDSLSSLPLFLLVFSLSSPSLFILIFSFPFPPFVSFSLSLVLMFDVIQLHILICDVIQ